MPKMVIRMPQQQRRETSLLRIAARVRSAHPTADAHRLHTLLIEEIQDIGADDYELYTSLMSDYHDDPDIMS